ncbi:hypothetical protein HNY73_020406 [Argiope bruennichi]|uniref:Uncharacterized protein n=1 Tax=Argiope bruennichi TaxID=94029 RepID=A0A8T0E6M4_ARGBR|nr:hypothetical protein HNY73_020406 [Argiope bruennichi]
MQKLLRNSQLEMELLKNRIHLTERFSYLRRAIFPSDRKYEDYLAMCARFGLDDLLLRFFDFGLVLEGARWESDLQSYLRSHQKRRSGSPPCTGWPTGQILRSGK